MNGNLDCVLGLVISIMLLGSAQGIAQAQEYPTRSVRAIVGYPPGGAVDTNARLVGQKLSELWGQPVVIDNRAGAGSTIGAAVAAQAVPDGYSFLVASPAHAINATLYRKLPFDTETAFAPVSQLATSPLVLLVHPSILVRSVKELISLAKEKPGMLNYGSSGSGTSVHLAGALFNLVAGTDIAHIPYSGGGPAVASLLAGTVQIMFAGIEGMGQTKGGNLKALAMTTSKRATTFPEVPTVAESGLAGYDVEAWYGIYLPATTPRYLVNKLSRDVNRVLQAADTRDRFSKLGFTVVGSTPEQFAAFSHSEIEKWRKVINVSNIQLE